MKVLLFVLRHIACTFAALMTWALGIRVVVFQFVNLFPPLTFEKRSFPMLVLFGVLIPTVIVGFVYARLLDWNRRSTWKTDIVVQLVIVTVVVGYFLFRALTQKTFGGVI